MTTRRKQWPGRVLPCVTDRHPLVPRRPEMTGATVGLSNRASGTAGQAGHRAKHGRGTQRVNGTRAGH